MTIPLDEGFTVVTGPNGSGKSNILDGVLFCLGLANSKGMRADRLPDLVNSGMLRAGKSAETVVSVRFDLSDWQPDLAEEGLEASTEGPWINSEQKEWTVTRRLRVMPGGSYSSSYSADGVPCNLQQLQTQFRRLRIDPEGSNVVMQGDVTRIVSMSNRDRRGLIDELAGVALFDHRIEQTRAKLDEVHDRQERCQIVEQELLNSRHRLEKDCAKAKNYQHLREKLNLGRQQELVLAFESSKKDLSDLKVKNQKLGEQELHDATSLLQVEKNLAKSAQHLKSLQDNVKALGEDKLLAVQAELAGLETQSRELDRQAILHKQEGEKLHALRQDLLNRRKEMQIESKSKVEASNEKSIEVAEQVCRTAQAAVEVSRRRLAEVAQRSGTWLEEQRKRSLRKQELQDLLIPLEKEKQKIEESLLKDEVTKKELKVAQDRDLVENQQVHQQLDRLEAEFNELLEKIPTQKKIVNERLDELSVQKRTTSRLETEQSRLEREIARLESRKETLQESRGTSALRLLLESGLDGIHGLVAQLGEVDNCHRLALEVAAGSRLGQVVVDDDKIAAKAINLLKTRKAGRLTFLPLNKINNPVHKVKYALQKGSAIDKSINRNGLIGKAVELVTFEPIYREVFAYVYGETLVFKDIDSARIQLGLNRSVTLDGELLEKSGAMTGGSFLGRSLGLTFGRTADRDEAEPIRSRLLEIGETLVSSRRKEINLGKSLEEGRSLLTKFEQRDAALQAERSAAQRSHGPLLDRGKESSIRLSSLIETIQKHQKRLKELLKEVDPYINELNQLEERENLVQLDDNAKNWQRLQADLESADAALGVARSERDILLNEQLQRQREIERLEDNQKILLAEENRLKEAVKELSNSHSEWRINSQDLGKKKEELEKQQIELQTRFGEERRARDVAEAELANQRQKFQESQWNLERLRENRQALAEEIRNAEVRLKKSEQDLPDPLPEISTELRTAGLEGLRSELEQIQSRMEALEPVNMLALEELEQLENRLADLEKRLQVLSEERSELLLRIETVATLRQEAFMEAFEAVDTHFREIFASLSDGDGHLQLDNSEDPLEGGLTLVAHPKGKTVRRLAAMSGGEKSLTALSFLFALQRFRPSPFYALDEVDSFLDGVNVERLSALIARQAEQAQFLVVSHRRPMIAASHRTIGVTQARGAHTQVVGLPNAA